ncbi:BTB/POZ protein [Xylariaceae sp. AK1471]|nr:BTB/POZ protein [Xylariaceae sp. AK1471]
MARFAKKDFKQDLLELECFSDVTVQCGKKTWNLHRAVLAGRCLWFKKALTGNFKEARTRVVRIEEFDEEWIGWLIQYIYTGDFDEFPKAEERSFTCICMELFDLADYFLLPELCKASEMGFANHVFTIAPEFQQNAPQGEANVNELFAIIREVYTREMSPAADTFRPALTMVLNAVQYGLFVEHTAFLALIEEIPAVAADMMTFGLKYRNARGLYPERCDRCRLPRTSNLGFSVVFPQTGALRCFCYHCDAYRENMYGPWQPPRDSRSDVDELGD